MRYLDVGTAKRISKIGLGTHQFGSSGWNYGERYVRREAGEIVRRALELGVTLFDTAETYGCRPHRIALRAMLEGVALTDMARAPGFGRSEEILGRALGDQREAAFLTTKFYPVVPAGPVPGKRAAASASRLGTGYIDLFQIHQPPHLTPPDSVMGGVRALQRAGVVREVGVSNASLARWQAAERALGSRVLSNQVGYSLVNRSAERDLLPFAEAHGRLVIAFRPLELGLLSGKYDAASRPADRMRTTHPLFLPENLERATDLIAAVRQVAEAHSATPSQIALAWLIRNPVVVAIPGASTVAQLESNAAAADIDLSDEEYRLLRSESERFSPITGTAALGSLIRSRLGR